MRLFVLLAAVTAASCVVDVDPSNTRFKCAEDPVCPDGFQCVSGMCKPLGAADAAPEPPDAPTGTPDAAPDAPPALPSCDAIYGEALEYILCEQTEDTCAFNVRLNDTSCNDLCPTYGGTCEGALDNDNGAGVECIAIGVDTCASLRSTEICICSRQ